MAHLFFCRFLKKSQVLMLSDSSLKAPWHVATLNSEDCWMARSQIISQLIGQTLVQLSQCFHHPPSSYGDKYIIFAPSSTTAPSLCWWSQVDLNYKARCKKDVSFSFCELAFLLFKIINQPWPGKVICWQFQSGLSWLTNTYSYYHLAPSQL